MPPPAKPPQAKGVRWRQHEQGESGGSFKFPKVEF
jgi:hypothetical protein